MRLSVPHNQESGSNWTTRNKSQSIIYWSHMYKYVLHNLIVARTFQSHGRCISLHRYMFVKFHCNPKCSVLRRFFFFQHFERLQFFHQFSSNLVQSSSGPAQLCHVISLGQRSFKVNWGQKTIFTKSLKKRFNSFIFDARFMKLMHSERLITLHQSYKH